MMAWTDPIAWLARHALPTSLTGREPEDDVERMQTRDAIERGRRAAETWERDVFIGGLRGAWRNEQQEQ